MHVALSFLPRFASSSPLTPPPPPPPGPSGLLGASPPTPQNYVDTFNAIRILLERRAKSGEKLPGSASGLSVAILPVVRESIQQDYKARRAASAANISACLKGLRKQDFPKDDSVFAYLEGLAAKDPRAFSTAKAKDDIASRGATTTGSGKRTKGVLPPAEPKPKRPKKK